MFEVVDGGWLLKYHRHSKYFLILIVAIILAYVPILFDLNYNTTSMEFDSLYSELKNAEQNEDSFLKFISLGEKSCDYLLKKLAVEKDALMKRYILQIIGFIRCSNCEEELIPFLRDPDWQVRFFTIDVLDKFEYDKLVSLLHHIILNDPNTQVKIGAIMALGKLGNTKDLPFLDNLAAEKEYQDKNLIKAISIASAQLKLTSSQKLDCAKEENDPFLQK